MNDFVQRHKEKVIGWMSGFDRLWFRGTLRLIVSVGQLLSYMRYKGGGGGVLNKDFGGWSEAITEQVKEGSRAVMKAADRPVIYLARGGENKETLAREIAVRDKIEVGPVCLLETLELSPGFQMQRNRERKMLELHARQRLCLHQYAYWVDQEVGMCHVRMQSWLPLGVFISMNGREWLCRSLTKAEVPFVRRDNCLVWVKDMDRARELLAGQLQTPWEQMLGRIVARANPVLPGILRIDGDPLKRYWSTEQCEWATDTLFKKARDVEALYPLWARQAMLTCGSQDVMRFLGARVTVDGGVPKAFPKEVVSDLRTREEGMRIKHRVGKNSVKLYNKQGSVLRTETTVHDPHGLRAYRGTEKNPQDKKWRQVRKGVADLHRLAQIAEGSNQRYLSFLSKVECAEKLGDVMAPLCGRVRVKGKHYRGLRVLGPEDGALLEAAGRGEWAIKGFTNGQLRAVLNPGRRTRNAKETQRERGRMSRHLSLLRAHGIIRKVGGTRRWMLTEKGRLAVTLAAAAKHASAKELLQKAA